jgi:F1F0 ATPase subunit 2
MNDAPILALVLAVGVLIGAVFFGGLWWTVRKSASSRRPSLLFMGSLLLRMTVTISGFYLVSRGDWRRLLICLVGFQIARIAVMRLTGAPTERGSRVAEESGT